MKISNDIVEVYKVGAIKIGELNKVNSSKVIKYLRDENIDVEARIKSIDEYRCRLEIYIRKKRYIMKTNYLKDKSLLIEGVEVIDDNGKSLLDEEKELILSDGYTLEEDIRIREEKKKERIERRKKKEERDKKLAPFGAVGTLLLIIGMMGLLFLFFRLIFVTSETNDLMDSIFYTSLVLIFVGALILAIISKSRE